LQLVQLLLPMKMMMMMVIMMMMMMLVMMKKKKMMMMRLKKRKKKRLPACSLACFVAFAWLAFSRAVPVAEASMLVWEGEQERQKC